MGHNTEAFIGKMPIKLDKVELYGLAVAIEGDFAIVFLDETHLMHWQEKLNLDYTYKEPNFEFAGELINYFAAEIGFEQYVIAKLDTEYYGVLYEDDSKIDEGHINPMLQKLGVKVTNKKNEFHQLNLDDYRMSECYYWEGDSNWAKFKENVIPGHVK